MKNRITERDIWRLSKETKKNSLRKGMYWTVRSMTSCDPLERERTIRIAAFWFSVARCL